MHRGSTGASRSELAQERFVAARLDVVTIGIADEAAVVMLVILGPCARRAVVGAAGRDRRGVEVAHDLATTRTERDVDLIVRLARAVDPEVCFVVRAEARYAGKVCEERVAERGECFGVERDALVEIADPNASVID